MNSVKSSVKKSYVTEEGMLYPTVRLSQKMQTCYTFVPLDRVAPLLPVPLLLAAGEGGSLNNCVANNFISTPQFRTELGIHFKAPHQHWA
jgi:hypothetical protein